jgi:acyl carrier protein
MPARRLYREGAAVMNIEATIRDYIRDSFLDEGQVVELRSDADLLLILDSLQILRMLIDLESKYSIKVDNSELTPENLGTVERIAAFIAKKCRESVC